MTSTTQAQEQTGNQQQSLYERLGSTEGITSIVDDVIAEHLSNPIIKDTFVPYLDQPERFAKIRQHTIDFFCAGSGGPVEYSGRDMPATHTGMNISAAEYMAVMDDIMTTLEKHKIDQQSKSEVLMILWTLRGMIMGK